MPITLELTRTPSGFGGSCAFWLCSHCGRRVRFLYFKGWCFVCRNCARLNYRSQQRTKDSTNHAYAGLRLARERLHWEPPFPVVPMDFPPLSRTGPKECAGPHTAAIWPVTGGIRRSTAGTVWRKCCVSCGVEPRANAEESEISKALKSPKVQESANIKKGRQNL